MRLLNLEYTTCIVTLDGNEVGRVAASDQDAQQQLIALAEEYGNEAKVQYVEDDNAPPNRASPIRELYARNFQK